MPFNGTGVFTRIYSWQTDQANGVYVRADRMDTDSNDIATGLSNCITKDGQQTITANIPFAGYKITGLGNGAASGDAVNFGQVFTAPSFTGGITVAGGATIGGGLTVSSGTVTMTSATSVLVPTATAGDNSTKAASTAFATALAFTAALPAQATHADNVPTTDGVNASWTPNLKATVIRFKDGTDASKLMAFDVSGVTTATTRTVAIPNKNGTMAMTSDIFMTLLATITPTASANVDALSVFSSTYDNYLVYIDGVKPSASDTLQLRLANAGVVDSGTKYPYAYNVNSATGAAQSNMPVGGNTVLNTGLGCTVILNILNANDTANIKLITAQSVCQIDNAPTYGIGTNTGAYTGANAVSGLRLYWSGGANFAATGKVRIYGYN